MPMPTRRDLEATLLQRVGALWAMAGKSDVIAPADAFTPNLDLDDPLAVGAGAAGVTLAEPGIVADADVAVLSGASRSTLLAAAELRAKQTILGNWTKVTMSSGGMSKQLSDLLRGLLDDIKQLREALAEDPTGTGNEDVPTVGLTAGWILPPGRSKYPEF